MKTAFYFPADRKFLQGNFATVMKKIWPSVFEVVNSISSIDRIVWSLDALSDEEGMAGVLASPDEPKGLCRGDTNFLVLFAETYNDVLSRLNIAYDEEKSCSQMEAQVKKWLISGLRISWNDDSVAALRKRLIGSRKLGVFTAPNIEAIHRMDYRYLCGSKIQIELDLSSQLQKFCDEHECLDPRYIFIEKDERIVEVDFSSLDEFSVITSEIVGDIGRLAVEIVTNHRPKKLFLNKKTEISKSNLSKLLKLFQIDKPTFINQTKSEERRMSVDLENF